MVVQYWYLPDISKSPLLLPEIALRLGDRSFTQSIELLPTDLTKFVVEPAEFLKGTIQELTDAQQAALTLVFLWRSRLPVTAITSGETSSIADKYGVPVAAIVESLGQMDGAFVVRRREDGEDFWGFYRPTFADAITHILSERPDLVELYIRGAKIETLLSETVCQGAAHILNAIVIPEVATEHLVSRLLEAPNASEVNRSLFDYLQSRATVPLRLESQLTALAYHVDVARCARLRLADHLETHVEETEERSVDACRPYGFAPLSVE